jgi:3-demethoxyubiquinol 3-hydroxylase
VNVRKQNNTDRLLIGMSHFVSAFRLLPRTVPMSPVALEDGPAVKVTDSSLSRLELPPTDVLSPSERSSSIGLMRVNHVGEVCAQALYESQRLWARDGALALALRDAANDELRHLHWTQDRIAELGGRVSWLNPLWYIGSYSLGAVAAAAGDRWSLGFMHETELQVEQHLQGHLEQLPGADRRSRGIVEVMRAEEAAHAQEALALGGARMPLPIRLLMKLMARVMTTVAQRV